MKKTLTKLLFLFVLVLGVSTTYAQRMVTGKVTDSKTGEPLIGANVIIKGTSSGTITDIDGNYSLSVPEDAVLIFSYTGFADKSVEVSTTSGSVDASLDEGSLLDEVVVVGYGSQKEKEITSAVASVQAKDFNKGPISDPAQLLQGKVSGLQIYNRGGDPNRASTIRLRGISTVGANTEPLIVVDGIIGASLANVDPNDIEKMDVLKDGSAAAIYGSRGSSGVILVTTKKGKANKGVSLSYSGQLGTSTKNRAIEVLSAEEFKAAGGTDLGSSTDWLSQVTRSGLNNNHSVSAQGGTGNTTYRISANLRDVNGILKGSGFDQFNTRLNIGTKALNDKLSIDFNTSFTNKQSDFGFDEALRYSITNNPTAPIFGKDSKFPFNSDQFGGYFETLGLFDNYNAVSIINQASNTGKRRELNYGVNLGYNLLDNLTLNFRGASQNNTQANKSYYPTTSYFRGNATSPTRKGLAEFYNDDNSFKLYETYATFVSGIGASSNLTLTGGYSYQQNNFFSTFMSAGDFPTNDINFGNAVENSQDIRNAGFVNLNSDASPDEKIIAFFGRANLTFDDAIFLSASLRREGSTKLGEDNKWGLFPAVSAGVDLNKYLSLGGLDLFKFRVGYGVTGSLPRANGLSKEARSIVNAADGGVTTQIVRAANPNLKWEEKGETNIGIDFASGRFNGNFDVYNRDIKDFILERTVEPINGVNRQVGNVGKLNTKGLELGLNYDVLSGENTSYTTGIVFSTYTTKLKEYVQKEEMRANLGAPGQNGTNMIIVREGEEIGNIWGPVFDGVDEKGSPKFKDLNGDGKIVASQDKALDPTGDFQVLGNGIPDFELGWTNSITVGKWNVNAFIRGAFGHSLVNSFRAFYEPRISTQSSYNFMNTSKAVAGLTDARFSSLYVEKADFIKLDNISISRNIGLGDFKAISNLNVSITGQNLFTITGYTGADPEPNLVDYAPVDNGARVNLSSPDVLSPGIDRRNNYFSARTVTLGINFNF